MRKPPKKEMKKLDEEKKPLTGHPVPTAAPPLKFTEQLPTQGQVEIIVTQPSIRKTPRKASNEDTSDVEPTGKSDTCALTIPDEAIGSTPKKKGLRKSLSMTSITSKIREQRERFKRHECAGIILFLILGALLNILSYLASVYSAQLNAKIIEVAVANKHSDTFKLKSKLIEAPSTFVIGFLNFFGRLLSAFGTVLLVQAIATYFKRKRYNNVVKSAVEEADELIGDVHGGITDAAGECCLTCFQSAG